jgi:hypothetical protein
VGFCEKGKGQQPLLWLMGGCMGLRMQGQEVVFLKGGDGDAGSSCMCITS